MAAYPIYHAMHASWLQMIDRWSRPADHGMAALLNKNQNLSHDAVHGHGGQEQIGPGLPAAG
jgi:hypothetical protein